VVFLRQPRRKSRMVEISSSGSGEGPGPVKGPGLLDGAATANLPASAEGALACREIQLQLIGGVQPFERLGFRIES